MKNNQKPSVILFKAAQIVDAYIRSDEPVNTGTKYCCHAIAHFVIKAGLVDKEYSIYRVASNLSKYVPDVWKYFELFKPEINANDGKIWFCWNDHPEELNDSDVSLSQMDKIVQDHRAMALTMAAIMAEADGN